MTFEKGHTPWNKGLTKETDERVRKIAESKKGKERSEATKRKMSEAMKGENHPNYGKERSSETRKKISEAKMNENPENLSEIFTEDHKQVLFASILADGHLSNGNGVNYYFEETHSRDQKEYLKWKQGFLDIFGAKVRDKVLKNHKLNKTYEQVWLKTSSFPILTELHNKFYPDDKKAVTEETLNEIGKLGLAVWYLDGGSVSIPEDLIKLSTDSFTYHENVLIQEFLSEKFGVSPRVSKRRGKYYYLLFGAEGSEKLLTTFKTVFENYEVPESMFYKLGSHYEGNEERIKEARRKHNKYRRAWREEKRKEREKEKREELRKKKEKIKKLYWDEGLNSKKVGERMGYSGSGIRQLMQKLDIPRRSLSEAQSGERNGFYGKHHTEETKKKISESKRKGK